MFKYSPVFKWLKFFFKVILFWVLVLVLVLKLFGLEFIISIWNNEFYLKLLGILASVLIISLNLFEIYLIHKFKNSQLSISKYWPKFIINWLEGFKEISESEESIKDFKDMNYTQVKIYFFIILFTLFSFTFSYF